MTPKDVKDWKPIPKCQTMPQNVKACQWSQKNPRTPRMSKMSRDTNGRQRTKKGAK